MVSREMASNIKISTHVLDTSRGRAAAGISVSITKLSDGLWTSVGQGETNQDGRVNLVDGSNYTPGTYKLHFEVDKYFKTHGVDAFYPFVEVTFNAVEGEKYHIPVLLNPFGYTTYRGT
ncbi:5-hydroxyisourate hydrolase-like [Bradysia coprophila]|uniref:5-hydroxyisourate hydrolase-like n=1 Tax=Bradysia coprophila TaxID=38358 RepID=UPI00187DC79C|nr:5-hydroxyisourate hydrolase-like [Bradysia coprophila]